MGAGRLPEWLPNKKGMLALDTFKDNLRVFRCLAVYRGAHKLRNICQTRALARDFYETNGIEPSFLTVDDSSNIEKHFQQAVVVYTVSQEVEFELTKLPNYKGGVMTIGLFEGHVFFITNIQRLTRTSTCAHCHGRFDNAANLSRWVKICNHWGNQKFPVREAH